MNRKIISATVISLLAALSILPGAIPFVRAQSGASLFVDPPISSAVPGSTFSVSVDVNNVPNLYAYDVSLFFNNHVLSIVSVDFESSTVFAVNGISSCTAFPPTSPCYFVVLESASQAAGLVRSAITLQGPGFVMVSFPTPVLVVTFQVLASRDTPLTIDPSSTIAGNNNGQIFAVPTTIVSGVFLAAPLISLVKSNATVAPNQRTQFLHLGQFSVTLIATAKMTSKATVPGFATAQFTVIDPSGSNATTVLSQEMVFFPGQNNQLTANFVYTPVTGTYSIFVTLLVRPLLAPPGFNVVEESTTGLFFKVAP